MLPVVSFLKSRLLSGSGRGLVKRVPYMSIVERSEPSFKDLLDIYKKDEQARLAVDSVAYLVVGKGFYTLADGEVYGDRAKTVVDEFCLGVNLDEKLLLTVRDMVAFGACVWEIISPGDLRNVKILPLDCDWQVHRTPEGEVTSYTQVKGGRSVDFKPSELVFWSWNEVAGEPFGRGLLHTLAETVTYNLKFSDGTTATRTRPSLFSIRAMALDDLRKSLRHSIQKAAWEIDVSDSQIAGYASVIGKLEPGERILTNKPTKIHEEKLDPRGHWEAHLTAFENAYAAALQSPVSRMYSDPGRFSEASMRAVQEMFFDSVVNAVERKVKRIVEARIFTPVLIEAGFNPSRAGVRLSWGIQEEEQVTLQDLFRGVELGVVRVNEARSILRKTWGFELEDPDSQSERCVQSAEVLMGVE